MFIIMGGLAPALPSLVVAPAGGEFWQRAGGHDTIEQLAKRKIPEILIRRTKALDIGGNEALILPACKLAQAPHSLKKRHDH